MQRVVFTPYHAFPKLSPSSKLYPFAHYCFDHFERGHSSFDCSSLATVWQVLAVAP